MSSMELGSMQVQTTRSVEPGRRLRLVAPLMAVMVALSVALIPTASSASTSSTTELVFYRASDGLAVTGSVDSNGVFTNQRGVGLSRPASRTSSPAVEGSCCSTGPATAWP
jgi:hypothetical protein